MGDQPTQPGWGPPPQQPPPQRPPGEWGAPPPPKPPSDKPPWWRRTWVVATATFFLGAIVGTAGGNDQPQVRTVTVTSVVTSLVTPATTVGATTTAPPTTRPAATSPPTTQPPEWTDGTYEVGKEIRPGTYKTPGGGGEVCYYARLRSDDTSDIIANNLSKGPMTVRVRSSDKFVEFNGGCTWRKV